LTDDVVEPTEMVVEPAPEPEPEPAPEPTVEAPAEDSGIDVASLFEIDPNEGSRNLSAEEIAAMFNSVESAAPVEVVAPEEEGGSEAAEEPADAGADADSLVDLMNEADMADLSELLNDADTADIGDGLDTADSTEEPEVTEEAGSDISLESLLAETMDEEQSEQTSAEPEELDLSNTDAIDALLSSEPSLDDLMAESDDADISGSGSNDNPDLPDEDIDAMLNAAMAAGNEEDSLSSDGDDILSLLASAGDEDLGDIQSLLDSDEKGEAVDESALLAATSVEDVASGVLDTPEEAKAKSKEEKKAAKLKAKEEKKAAKAAKKAGKKGGSAEGEAAEGDAAAEPKQGFFAKILGALTEDLDEDDKAPVKESIPDDVEGEIDLSAIAGGDDSEPKEMAISDENKEILEELDKEKKKKKGKKKKKKKGKGGEAEGGESEGDEEGEEGEEGGKKKKKKERKKKEKAPKAEEVPSKPEKKLPKKRVRATFILCLSILAGIIILSIVVTNKANLTEARYAFDTQDYQTTYEDLYGLELKGEDQDIFNKSQIILIIDRKLRSYQNYRKLGMNDKALDALLEGVKIYPEVLLKAEEYSIVPQVSATYSQILDALGSYGLSEADAVEINGYDSRVKYTKRIESIVNGTPFTYDSDIAAEYAAPSGVSANDLEPANMVEDILPEETDFLPDDPNSIFEEGIAPEDGAGPEEPADGEE
jgi:hypothetical protein